MQGVACHWRNPVRTRITPLDSSDALYIVFLAYTVKPMDNAADIEGLVDELNITNWDDLVFNSDNINDVYSNFLKMLYDAVKKYIPTKTITVRPNDKPCSLEKIYRNQE